MSSSYCPEEEAVAAAIARGKLAGELAVHVDGCPDCRAAVRLAALLHQQYPTETVNPPISMLNAVWITALQQERVRSIHRQITGTLVAGLAGVLAAGATAWVIVPAEPLGRLLVGGLPLARLPWLILPLVSAGLAAWLVRFTGRPLDKAKA